MLGASFRFHVLHFHAPRAQARTDGLGALAIVLTRWVHRRNANQLPGEVHELVTGLLDFGEHAIDGIGARHEASARGEKAMVGGASSYAPTPTAKDPPLPLLPVPPILRTLPGRIAEEASRKHARRAAPHERRVP